MKLTKQHICAYLPYNVKAEMLNYERDYVGIRYDTLIGMHQWDKDGKYWSALTVGGSKPNIEDIKLLLRPLSELHYYSNGLRHLDYEVGEYSINHIISKIKGRLCEYDIIEMCLKEHIDIFGLIENGLAIDLNTLKF